MLALPPWLRALLTSAGRVHRCEPNVGEVFTLSAGASRATPRPLYSRCAVCGARHYVGKYIGTLRVSS